MLSVRVAAAGAVASVFAFLLTVPASACDFDRYQKKCDREIAAREQADGAPVAQRRSAKRARITQAQRVRPARADRRVRSAPRFATRRDDGMKPSAASTRTAHLPESAMTRRFRGFIDPRPVGDNAFESMRKPHLNAHDFHAAMILQPVQVAQAALITASDAPAAAVTRPKQDRVVATAPAAAKPAAPAAPAAPATMTLASAESKTVVLAPLASKPAAAPPVAPPAVMQASVIETGGPAGPNPFSIHTLVLALCGALGAASALRFIVGA